MIRLLRNVSISVKLLILLLIPLVVFSITCITLIQSNHTNLNKLAEVLYTTTSKSTSLILNADRDMYQALYFYEHGDSKELQENIQQAKDRVESAYQLLAKNELTALTHENSGHSVQQTIDAFRTHFDKWSEQASQSIGKNDPRNTDLMQTFENGREGLNEIGEILDMYAEKQIAISIEQNNKSQTITFIVIGVMFVGILLVGLAFIRQILTSVRSVLHKTRLVAEGDLRMEDSQTVRGNDELARISQAIDAMTERVRDLVQQIAQHTERVNLASGNLHSSSQESAAAASHIASNIDKVASSVEVHARSSEETSQTIVEMSTGIQRVADSVAKLAEDSSVTALNATKGSELLSSLHGQFAAMTHSTSELAAIIDTLNGHSARIGTIVDNITQFAQQTNLLSLNASIEAARAGEHGKGFAVVAHEIRKLAENSRQSADEIAKLIGLTRADISEADAHTRTSLAETESGNRMMQEVQDNFSTILSAVQSMQTQIHESSAVTEEMSASSEQIAASMQEVSITSTMTFSRTQNVAAAVEEQLAIVEHVAETSAQLKHIVEELNQSVSTFRY